MPVPFLQNLSKSTGKPLADLERYWKEAKDQVGDNYAQITAIVKRRAGVKESFVESDLNANDFLKLYKHETI